MHRLLAFGAPVFTLCRQQWVPQPVDEAFPFFENPRNLSRITPRSLDFRIKEMKPEFIREGTLITYRLRSFGVPYTWRTLIAEWVPGERFVDTQIQGPYILWRHTHTFEACQGGALFTDRVEYRLPFGPIGVLLHGLLIRRQLTAIFDYRALMIADLLSNGELHISPPQC